MLEASTDDGPMLVTINTTAQRWAKHPSLGIRVGFAIPLNEPDPGGFATSSELSQIDQIDEEILRYVNASGPAIHVLTITTGIFKEFVYYIENGDAVAGIHEKLLRQTFTHNVQCIAIFDPEWETYDSFLIEDDRE